MDKSNLKNIVVLKDLPSNIVDEAIIILKHNKKIKKLEVLDKKSNINSSKKENNSNIHVVNEAQMLINDYISEIEKKENKENSVNKFKEKYKRLKKYTFLISSMLLISIILHFI